MTETAFALCVISVSLCENGFKLTQKFAAPGDDVMLENTLIRRLLATNTLILICIAFTITTLLDLILTVIAFGDVGTSYVHLGSRLIICTFVCVSLLVFRYFKKLHLAYILGIHFLFTLLFVVLYTWIIGFFIEQHPNAMFYMVRSVLIVYPIMALVCIAIDFAAKRLRAPKKGQ